MAAAVHQSKVCDSPPGIGCGSVLSEEAGTARQDNRPQRYHRNKHRDCSGEDPRRHRIRAPFEGSRVDTTSSHYPGGPALLGRDTRGPFLRSATQPQPRKMKPSIAPADAASLAKWMAGSRLLGLAVSVYSAFCGLSGWVARCEVVCPRRIPPRRPISAMCWRFWLMVSPPLRPATRASSGVNWWAFPFSWEARPPMRAISFWRIRSMDAKPRLAVRSSFFVDILAFPSKWKLCGPVGRARIFHTPSVRI